MSENNTESVAEGSCFSNPRGNEVINLSPWDEMQLLLSLGKKQINRNSYLD